MILARSGVRAALLLSAIAIHPAPAATRTWPNLSGAGPCQGTLQNCIDTATAGDSVQIGNDDLLLPDGYTAIQESISIAKSLDLSAAPGIDAVFSPGHALTLQSIGSDAVNIHVSRLSLRAGHLEVRHGSSADSHFGQNQLRLY